MDSKTRFTMIVILFILAKLDRNESARSHAQLAGMHISCIQ
jgi:hypothetical protein